MKRLAVIGIVLTVGCILVKKRYENSKRRLMGYLPSGNGFSRKMYEANDIKINSWYTIGDNIRGVRLNMTVDGRNFVAPVRGVTFKNRQDLLRALQGTENVEIKHTPHEKDPYAMGVYVIR